MSKAYRRGAGKTPESKLFTSATSWKIEESVPKEGALYYRVCFTNLSIAFPSNSAHAELWFIFQTLFLPFTRM